MSEAYCYALERKKKKADFILAPAWFENRFLSSLGSMARKRRLESDEELEDQSRARVCCSELRHRMKQKGQLPDRLRLFPAHFDGCAVSY